MKKSWIKPPSPLPKYSLLAPLKKMKEALVQEPEIYIDIEAKIATSQLRTSKKIKKDPVKKSPFKTTSTSRRRAKPPRISFPLVFSFDIPFEMDFTEEKTKKAQVVRSSKKTSKDPLIAREKPKSTEKLKKSKSRMDSESLGAIDTCSKCDDSQKLRKITSSFFFFSSLFTISFFWILVVSWAFVVFS